MLFFVFRVRKRTYTYLGVSIEANYVPFVGRSATVAVEVDPVDLVVALFPISPEVFGDHISAREVVGREERAETVARADTVLGVYSKTSSVDIVPLRVAPKPRDVKATENIAIVFLRCSFFSFSFDFA